MDADLLPWLVVAVTAAGHVYGVVGLRSQFAVFGERLGSIDETVAQIRIDIATIDQRVKHLEDDR